MKPIHLRNVPPPAETFNHTEFFSNIFSWLRPENYLELGVRDGINFTTLSRFCKKSIGVDVDSPKFYLNENMEYHTTTTDDYFLKLDKNTKFDAVFIDADHSHEQSLKDFLNVKDMVVEDGFIFLHDTYPYDSVMFDPGLCNDVYKTALYIKQNLSKDFECLTLPFNPGVTIVKKMNINKQLIYLD